MQPWPLLNPIASVLPFSAHTSAITSAFTAVANFIYPVDTSGGSFAVALPASPSPNDRVGFINLGGSSNALNMTSASQIQTLASIYAPNVSAAQDLRSGGSVVWQYNSALNLWLVRDWQPSTAPPAE